VDPDQVILTASTSEAYAVLFKLLCNAGDQVLVPEPSYPLFDLLTRLDMVTAAPYRLEDHGVWSIDRASLAAAAGPRTRAVLVVSPNNPTGSRLRADDHEWLVDFAQRRSLAVISDEVFIDYPLMPRPDASTLLGEPRVLTFTLGGLSKAIGLPQAKLGWMVVSGPKAQVTEAKARLEVICDTYLSVSTPVQVAAGRLLEAGEDVRDSIRTRVADNLEALRLEALRHPGIRIVEPEGGWACVLQVPSRGDEESLVLLLLRDQHIVVHPGYFFDFHRGAHLVVSLLPNPQVFREAVARVMGVAE
jgi:aspartate/methionine/tyrosine aminotransferase